MSKISQIESGSCETTRNAPASYGWPVLLALFVIMFLTLGTWHSFGVFLKYLARDFAASRGLISGVMSLTWLVYGVVAIQAGKILDRKGPKTVMTVGMFVVGLAYIMASLASSPWHLYLSLGFLLGVGMPVFWVIPAAMVSKRFEKKRGLVLGLLLSAGGAGQIMIPPLASFFIGRYGWQATYVILGVLIWAGATPLALLLRRYPEAAFIYSNLREQPLRREDTGSTSAQSLRNSSVAEAIGTPAFWLLLAIWFFIPLSSQAVILHVVPYATDVGINAIRAATILSVLGFANAAGRIMAGSASDRLGSRPTYAICLLLMILAVFALVWARELGAFYIAATMFGLGLGGATPVYVKMVVELFGPLSSGQVIGIMSCAWATGSAIAAWTTGHIFDVSGSYVMAFAIGGAMVLLALTLVPLLRNPQQGQ